MEIVLLIRQCIIEITRMERYFISVINTLFGEYKLQTKNRRSLLALGEETFFFFFLGHMGVPRLGVESECSCQPMPHPQQHQIWAASVTYAAACGNDGSLSHWARPGIKPVSSWTLCRVLNLLNHNWNSWHDFDWVRLKKNLKKFFEGLDLLCNEVVLGVGISEKKVMNICW